MLHVNPQTYSYQIVTDTPGKLLHLVRPREKTSFGVYFLVALVPAFLFLTIRFWVPELRSFLLLQWLTWGWPFFLLIALLASLAPFLCFFGVPLLQKKRYWSELCWDADKKLFMGRRGLLGSWHLIPFSSLRGGEVSMAPESKKALFFTLTFLREEKGIPKRKLRIPLRVTNLDKRAQAMDLVVRIARVIGWKGYRIVTHTPQKLTVEYVLKLAHETKKHPYRKSHLSDLHLVNFKPGKECIVPESNEPADDSFQLSHSLRNYKNRQLSCLLSVAFMLAAFSGFLGALAFVTNLRGANLNGADLRKADLRGAYLRGASLREADLRGANLNGAKLQKANLYKAKLQKANLSGTDLTQALLQNAQLNEANLQRARLRFTRLDGANLSGANLQGARLYRTFLLGANLNGANLEGVRFRRTYLHDVTYNKKTRW